MCIVTLSVLGKCRHELATIDYCDKVDGKDIPSVTPGEKTKPCQTCTESLGWLIYKSLNAPVTCEPCKKWLTKKDKRTYSGVSKEPSKDTGAEKKSTALTTAAQRRKQPSEAVHAENGAAGPTQLGSPTARKVGTHYD